MSERAARVSDDLRYELLEAARGAERRNRPRVLLFLATALFLAAGIYLIVALGAREAAVTSYSVQRDRVQLVGNLDRQFLAVESATRGAQGDETVFISDVLTRIEGAAEQAGLRDRLAIPSQQARADGELTKREYGYTVRDPSLAALLEWVDVARMRVPGLKVQQVELRPEAQAWSFGVTFVRWERSS